MRKSAPSCRWRRRCAAEEPRRAAHSSFLLPAFPGFSLLWLLGRRADTESLGSAFLFFIFSIGCPPHTPDFFVRFRLPLALQAGATLFSDTIPGFPRVF